MITTTKITTTSHPPLTTTTTTTATTTTTTATTTTLRRKQRQRWREGVRTKQKDVESDNGQSLVSVQGGSVALGKSTHARSASSLSSLSSVALETVPMFVWLDTDRSRPLRVECRLHPFPTPLSFMWSVLWCPGLSLFRKFLNPLGTSTLTSCWPGVMFLVAASLHARSFPLIPAWSRTEDQQKYFQPETAWLCASRGSPS